MRIIKNVVILGGGTAGWISAALLNKLLPDTVNITLVESDAIATIGVGEATIPPIQQLNAVLGIDEAEFLKHTKATMKLAIKFEHWRNIDQHYFHTFGAPGKSLPFCLFHHLWLRAKSLGLDMGLWDFDLNYNAAVAGRFSKIQSQDSALELPYAYHFDAGLYAKFLRAKAENAGVKRLEGKVETVQCHSQTGDIESLTLDDKRVVSGDLFIDCSGFRSLLLRQETQTGFEDWSHWLPCDRAVAAPSERFDTTAPYTRSIAHSAGWQWQIPLQHRNGNGVVYSSAHCSFEQACSVLEANVGSKLLHEPREIRFQTGRAKQQWQRNVIGIGLSSGFVEPLESTSIHLIQSGIVRLVKLFPHHGVSDALRCEYNRQSQIEFEQIRDFIILHYHQTERTDSEFWRDLRSMSVPDSLQRKIALFEESAAIVREQDDLFAEASWLQVLLGQGVMPKDYHATANAMSDSELNQFMRQVLAVKKQTVFKMPTHDEYIGRLIQSAAA